MTGRADVQSRCGEVLAEVGRSIDGLIATAMPRAAVTRRLLDVTSLTRPRRPERIPEVEKETFPMEVL
jgi:hypothetical protein